MLSEINQRHHIIQIFYDIAYMWNLKNNTMNVYAKQKVKVTQLCPTLCKPMDYTVHGIVQARILDWVAFPFSGGSSQPRD